MSSERHKSWELIDFLCKRDTFPLIIGGDRNSILSPLEKMGGAPYMSYSYVNLGNILQENGLIDLRFSGYPFTRHRGNPHSRGIAECLDQFCAYLDWQNLFPNVRVWHISFYLSDYSPILLESTLNHCYSMTINLRRFERWW